MGETEAALCLPIAVFLTSAFCLEPRVLSILRAFGTHSQEPFTVFSHVIASPGTVDTVGTAGSGWGGGRKDKGKKPPEDEKITIQKYYLYQIISRSK